MAVDRSRRGPVRVGPTPSRHGLPARPTRRPMRIRRQHRTDREGAELLAPCPYITLPSVGDEVVTIDDIDPLDAELSDDARRWRIILGVVGRREQAIDRRPPPPSLQGSLRHPLALRRPLIDHDSQPRPCLLASVQQTEGAGTASSIPDRKLLAVSGARIPQVCRRLSEGFGAR